MKFKCLDTCSKCCEDVAWVNLSLQDLRRIAEHLKISMSDTFRKYGYIKPWVEDGKVVGFGMKLLEPCPFLNKDGLCDIHDISPLICQIFPQNTVVTRMKGRHKQFPCLRLYQMDGMDRAETIKGMERIEIERAETEKALPILLDVTPYQMEIYKNRCMIKNIENAPPQIWGMLLKPTLMKISHMVADELEGIE